MIDDTDVVTYHSENCARTELAWVAYVVLPNGEYWGVRFNGATEEIARTKAIATWNAEREKYKKLEPLVTNSWDSVPEQKQHHFANKIWMRHKQDRTLVRVLLTEITMYEGKGYIRSGPRSK